MLASARFGKARRHRAHWQLGGPGSQGHRFVPRSRRERNMGHITTFARKHLSAKTFGLSSSRKYPMPDRSHVANAKARATQMVKKGKLSAASAAKIRAKANSILGEKHTGKLSEMA